MSPPSSDQADGEHVAIGGVRVHEVAAAEERRGRRAVAREPVLVEGDSLRHALLARRDGGPPREAVRRAVDLEAGRRASESERGDEPRRVRRVVRDHGVARSRVGACRAARSGEARQEAAPPRGAVVRRHREPDVRRAAVEASSDLEGGNGRPTEREAVGLDLGLVLRAVRPVGVAREPAPHELAVARHDVGEVGVHDVEAGPAAYDVSRAVVRARDQVVAGTCVVRVASGPALEEVPAAPAEQLVAPSEATDEVGAWRSDESITPRRAGDAACASGGDAENETDEDECEKAHRLSVTRPVTPGFAGRRRSSPPAWAHRTASRNLLVSARRGFEISSEGGPSSMISPRCMNAMRDATSRANPIS